MRRDVELPYVVGEQFLLLLKAMDAIHPFAASAGIKTNYSDTYDEWENIVEALYCSFIVQPIVDTQITYDLQDFAQIGYHNRDGAKLLRFLFEINGDELLLHDIGLADDGHFKLLAFRHNDTANALYAIDSAEIKKASNVRVVSSPANAPVSLANFRF